MEIIKIPMREKGKPRVCAYARVSTKSEAQECSLAMQTRYWEDKFNGNNEVEYVGLFADDGISGKEMRNRKALNEVLLKVRNGEIDRVYTKSISRFARNYTEIIAVIREFKELGVPIIFEKEALNTLDPKCGLLLNIMASLAEEELKSMSKNQKWAARKRFAQGSIELTQIYGYRLVDGQLIVNQEEKELIKSIYSLYMQGNGIPKICRILTDRGYKTMHGGVWSKSTIRTILSNEKYVGDCLLQKCYYDLNVKIPNKGELPQYYIENSHEAIIDKETFEAVQQRLSERAKKYLPSGSNNTGGPLAGKIKCGKCGARFKRKTCAKGKSYETYKWTCRTKDQMSKAVCGNSDIKEDVIITLLIDAFNESLDKRQEILDIAEEERQLHALLNTEKEIQALHIKGYISKETFLKEKDEILNKIRAKEQAILNLKNSIDIQGYEKSAEFTKDMADFLIEATIDDWIVTFKFANGYETQRKYTNGRAGNVNGKLCRH
ncbi:MAG: recombinase family protein [Clostridia bacterium]|nr:recombinase family protein [Clostridia bacterium]